MRSEPIPLESVERVRHVGIAEFAALPMSIRIADHLAEVLVALAEIKGELETEEANPILWIEPHVDSALRDVERLLRRFVV